MIGALTLDQLRVLVAIADEGSFSAAARRLRRAQSAVSQAMANLERVQGVTLFDRSAYRPAFTQEGRVLVTQARHVLAGAERFEAIAAGTREGVEAELALAIDPLVPSLPLIRGLRELGEAFPDLPVRFSTETLGGSLRRLRAGEATLAVCLLLPVIPDDVAAYPLLSVTMRPVVAPSHPLARLGRPVTRDDLEGHVQLVLSDPVEPDAAGYGLLSRRLWRFVDLARRLDFLLAGLGWCRMPDHLAAPLVEEGRLVELRATEDVQPPDTLTIYAAHRRADPPKRAGRFLLDALRSSLRPRDRD